MKIRWTARSVRVQVPPPAPDLPYPRSSTFICGSHIWQTPHVVNEVREQGRGIVAPPRESQRERHVQIGHGQDDNRFRAPPTRRSQDPSHSQAARYQAEDSRLIRSLLNDAGRLEAATIAFMHHAVVERRAWPPWKPDERCIRQVPQSDILEFCERMSCGRGQLDMLPGDEQLVQVRVGFWHEVDESSIQTAGPDGFYLFHTRRWLKLDFCVGLHLPHPPTPFRNHTPPTRILGEPDAQRAGPAIRNTSGARGRVTYFLKKTARILQ